MARLAAAAAPVEQASALWTMAKARALKRRTLTYAEAASALGIAVDEVPAACHPIHVWCWMRGMPPLNVVVVPRGKTPATDGGFDAADYDVVHEALGHSVYTLEHAWHYPWTKVPDPTPEQLAGAVAAHASHGPELRRFRFLDLELELRLRDEARGRRRPIPQGHADWRSVEVGHAAVATQLAAAGIVERDLRPGGKGPYPPPRPAVGHWAD